MKSLVIATALVLSQSVHATPNQPTPLEFQALMALDYQAFDQTPPDGGWRGIVDNVDAGKTLDAYRVHHLDTLVDWQARVITWHAGQVYAMADLKELGVARFKKSFNPAEPADDQFKWNAYVRGSIAFLEKDKATLIKARDEVLKADPENVNGKLLAAFVRCFDKSYKEAYSTDCK
jgi:hypothetical protein